MTLFAFLVIEISFGFSVLKMDQCSECSKLIRKQDCEYGNCIWSTNNESIEGICIDNGSNVDQGNSSGQADYCKSILNPAQNCSKVKGCAYFNSSCTFFTGCSAYFFHTTFDCQQISLYCISEGDGCIDAKKCEEYLTQDICENSGSSSGSGHCKWDSGNSKCRDELCSEAGIGLTTDQECSKFKFGCITKGQGCTESPLKECKTYESSGQDCSKLIGLDGPCELLQGSQFCQQKKCETAPITHTKDKQCDQYLKGCVSTGRGCVEKLWPCNTYNKDCTSYVGSDGICENEEKSENCRSRICENGLFNSDEDCNQYKIGCVTNGKSCVTTLQNCSSYKGNKNTCLGFIGLEGMCKGIDDNEQSCSVMDCVEDSDSKYVTDEQCQKIQKLCKTNGMGCVYNLKLCNEYDGSAETCFQMIGSDGKCIGGTDGKCQRRSCQDAPSTYNTDYECKNFQSGCVTNSNGCINQTSCQLTLKEVSCLGTAGCQWNSSCVDSTKCSNFNTQVICENNSAINYSSADGITTYYYTKCSWKNNYCQNLSCSDLNGDKYDSDQACQQVMSNCVYSGYGCVDRQSDCSLFKGSQNRCALYANKCWNDQYATETSPCRSRLCSDNIIFTTDEECAYFQKGCRTNGKGCIEDTKLCSDYQGTQAQCNKFTGFISNSSERQQCYNTIGATITTNCIVKTCDMAVGLTNNTDCTKFLKGCIWNGLSSCVKETSDCTAFYGTQQLCNTFIGNNQKCYGLNTNNAYSQCKIKQCVDNNTPGLTDKQCNDFLEGCVSNGIGCTPKETTCDQFSGTSDTCSKFLGNGQKCTRMSNCTTRLCSDYTNPTKHEDCYNYHSKCRFVNTQTSCIDQTICNNYVAQGNNNTEKTAYCRALKDDSNFICSYQTGDINCSNYSCEQIMTKLECESYTSTKLCYYINNMCVSTKDCSTIIIDNTSANKPTTNSTKLTWCNQYKDINNKQCSYHSTLSSSKCSNFILCEQVVSATSSADCNRILYQDPDTKNKGCLYYSNQCYTLKPLCSDYFAIGNNNTEKSAFCQAMKLNTSVGTDNTKVIQCQYVNGDSNCSSATCESVSVANNQIDCDKQALNCVYFQSKCYTKQNACTSYSTSTVSSNKPIFCSYMKNSSGEHCGYIDGMNNCINSSSDCKLYRWASYNSNPSPSPIPSTNSSKRTYCQQRRSSQGRLCGYIYGDSYCTLETNYCELIQSPSSQLSCDLQAIGCTYIQSLSICATTSRLTTCNDITFDDQILTTDADKLNYCKQVKNYYGYCTWMSGSGYCDDLTSACTSISISSISNDDDKKTYCLSRMSKAGSCAWRKGDTSSACRSFSCFDIINPVNQATCDSVMSGCTYYQKQCITSQANCNTYYADGEDDDKKLYYCSGLSQTTSNLQCTYIKGSSFCTVKTNTCASYTVSALSNADKLTWCYLLKDLSSNICAYSNGDSACKQITCELIISPQSQNDCNSYLSGCQFYKGYCYTKPTNCGSYSIPSTITDNVAFCTNFKNTSNQYCGYVSGSTCAAQSSCTLITAVGVTTTLKQQYCQARKSQDGYVCTYISGTYCSQVGTSLSCTYITGTITNQDSCQSISANCSYLDSTKTCDLNSNLNTCDKYLFSSTIDEDTKLSYCRSVLSGTCNYQFGDTKCSNQVTQCGQFLITNVNDKKSYCAARNSSNGNCAYDEQNESYCSQIKCSDIELPNSQMDCNKRMSGCTYYRNSCVQTQNNCNLYITYGSDDQTKKNYCEGLKSSDNTLCTFIPGVGVCFNQSSSCSSYDVSALTDKIVWCEQLVQSDGQICTNINDASSCSTKTYTCETITANSQSDCDKILENECIYYNTKCYTKQSSCSSYIIPLSITNKQLFCKNMFDSSQKYCTGGSTNCGLPTNDCTNIVANGSDDSQKRIYCRDYKSSDGQMCGYSSGLNCEIEHYYCSVFISATSQEYCDQRIDNCVYIQKSGKCIEKYLVSDCTTMLFNTGLSNANRISYCQSYNPNGNICTWNTATDHCELDTKQCIDFDATGQSDKRTFCQSKQGYNCSWRNGDTSSLCRKFKCQDVDLAQSQSDCDSKIFGCSFYINSCFTLENNCDNYYALGTDNQLKQYFCNGIPTISNQKCTYLSDDYKCRVRDQCTTYNVQNVSDKVNACLGMYNQTGIQCIYVKGNTCNQVDKCETYTGLSNMSNCTTLFDTNKRNCIQGNTSCLTFTCDNISNPTSQSDCDTQLKGLCFFNSTNSKCINISDCSTYKKSDWPLNADPIQHCSTLIDKNGHNCTADDATSILCRERLCSDKLFYLNSDCKEWKSSCKSDGAKCIESTKTCSQFTGNQDSCSKYLDSDNLNFCKVINGSEQDVGPCLSLSCYQNTTANSDSECQSYQNGCLTRGVGCIPNTAKCDEYRGTRDQCAKFTGYVSSTITEICSGDFTNTDQSKCRSRICSDNLIDNSDALCSYFKTGCVTNGQGCIDINASCSSYKGTQQQCSKFMGNNKTVYCWNNIDAPSNYNCIDKLCNHVLGTTDQYCEQEFPKVLINGNLTLLCISNGINCIKNPAKCSDFIGNNISCQTFTALIDGPCKGNLDNSMGYCQPRVCYEAPKSYNTDAQCQDYHPTCLTTGQGCMKFSSYDNQGKPTLNCNSIVSNDVCSLKLGCTLASQCLVSVSSCSQVKSQAICQTTILQNGKNCVYDLSLNQCREFQCNDYVGINDNNICQQFSNNCTTNGNGCEIMKSCVQYYEKLTCQSAYSTDPINRCIWTDQGCRQRECKDLKGTTNQSCKQFISGCITNGQNCVGPNYLCQDLLEKTCLTDYQGNPCIFYKQTCYSYSKCEDMKFTTHEECQQFSELCTSNELNCIPLNKCQYYTKQESCNIGIDGMCGWNNNKCNLFKQCSDVMGTSTPICQQYSNICVSDGVKCVEQNICSFYNSQFLCEHNKGLDGVCIWIDNACRLKQCEDLTTNTDTFNKCFNQLSPMHCSSNGTKCISLSSCQYYNEKSCIIGTDGPCIYKLPFDKKSGQISCRLKQCQDVIGKTLDVCLSAFDSSYKKCVSNGSICVDFNNCSSYTTKIACASGGLDGQCAFTPIASQSNDGICKLFTQCSDANSDKDTCLSNSKYCQWISSGVTKQCIPHTCLTYNSKKDCLPVPSYDQKSFLLCAKINNICQEVQPTTLTMETCYINSAQTYIWNTSTSKCVQCKIKTDNNVAPNSQVSTKSSVLLFTLAILFNLYF
ncbi:unnamed protein product [Paramecium primaurelia]|uniref:Uncharacterized protein n=1 Tax=Paramecium primaurelia TaxID=5886 RepID=A0A8S1MNS6_PARPR|nr:unnamed protein product [Paramecium primaurelia]